MNDNREIAPKPYKLVSFPKNNPQLKKPQGQDKFFPNRLHGRLCLNLTVETALHISTGVVMLGSDIGHKNIPLIKTMMTSTGEQLTIPGSSLKGMVRSVYEAITNSTLGAITHKYEKQNYYPKNRLPPRTKNHKKDMKLCPAGRIFGAMDWQGLIQFTDAKCEKVEFEVGFMPSLYSPRPSAYLDDQKKAKGRKFYYHASREAAASKNKGLQIQRAINSYEFSTEIRFSNLSKQEFGAFLIALGLDSKYPFALKIGAGKPVGMGTMKIELETGELWRSGEERYGDYGAEPDLMTEAELNKFMEIARKEKLIELDQLRELAEILKWPTEREPVEGLY
ncbi:MAG: RAMP superfamily CRISPR-associated protein [Cyanobacteriota bacterium]|nr:RAMP superfamily CRISPR-associated protein [Cyanobacteriota bacterium]